MFKKTSSKKSKLLKADNIIKQANDFLEENETKMDPRLYKEFDDLIKELKNIKEHYNFLMLPQFQDTAKVSPFDLLKCGIKKKNISLITTGIPMLIKHQKSQKKHLKEALTEYINKAREVQKLIEVYEQDESKSQFVKKIAKARG